MKGHNVKGRSKKVTRSRDGKKGRVTSSREVNKGDKFKGRPKKVTRLRDDQKGR